MLIAHILILKLKIKLMDIQFSLDNIIFLLLLVTTILYWSSLICNNFNLIAKIGFYGTLLANQLIFCLLSLRWINYGYFFMCFQYSTTSVLLIPLYRFSTVRLIINGKLRGKF